MKLHYQIRFFCLLFACCFLINRSTAQFARFRHLTVEDGLTQNSITCITQDKRGFIWIGTYNGLNKFDGYKITNYKSIEGDTSTLYHNSIRCLFADNDNNLWGGTGGGGMFRINLVTNKITNFHFDSLNANCISSDIVSSIKEYEPGKLYITTGDGLNIFDKKMGRFSVYRKIGKNSIPFLSDNIRQMTRDTRGHIWFTHLNAGVTEFDPKSGKCNHYSQNSDKGKLNSNNVKAIFADRKGLVWISCWNSGVNVIDTKSGKIFSSEDTLCSIKGLTKASLISQFYEDLNGNIWMATAEKGLLKLDSLTYEPTFYSNNKDDGETISDNTVFNVMQDKSGLLWAGTWQGGVNTLNLRTLKFGYYKHESNSNNTLSENNVSAISKKSDSEVYIGHSAAADIYNYKNGTFRKFPVNEKDENSLRNNSSVLYIFTDDKDSSVWFSTAGGYPYRYWPKTGKYQNYINRGDSGSFGHHTSYTILKDNKGKLWIGSTIEGLYLFDYEKNNFKAFKSIRDDEQTLISNNITSIVKNKEGKFWIGGLQGLTLFDPETKIAKRFLRGKNGNAYFKDNSIYSIYIDKADNLWLGTGSGLVCFNPVKETVRDFKQLHPAFLNIIYGILEDKQDVLWMSTDNGILSFNHKENSFRYFDTQDGLQGREFIINACYGAPDGKLFFGGLNGFNVFNPDEITFNNTPPQVVFTDFSVLNKPYALPVSISYINEIVLSYKDYFFSFDFASTDFTNNNKNIYEYKLEGFNENWVNIGNKHQVTFTNIDQGTYTLYVRATNNDGLMCNDPAAIKLIIEPPFWKTTWFYALCIMVTIFMIYLYIKYREQKLIKEKIILENKVEVRTMELKQEKLKVELAHKDIKDSINYAKRIQEAILPLRDTISHYLKNYFILYKPKDIVAGDFYWFHALPEENAVLIAAIDCTGHGVPGAFMSMIGNEQLSKIINEKSISRPDLILNELHKGIRSALKQDQTQGETRDGMDIALCKVYMRENYIEFAGAMRPLWIVRNNELIEVKADKQPIGGLDADYRKPFTNNKVDVFKNDSIYMFTDGFADQFGGEKGKKFMLKNFLKLLLECNREKMSEQENILNEKIEAWKGPHEQVDDVLVIGIKVV